MGFLNKKNYIIAILLTMLLVEMEVFAKDTKIKYKRENISNYFLGIVSVNKDYNDKSFKYLKKVQSLKNVHSKFNIEFIRTLVFLEKFEESFSFSQKIWKEDELFFEADLLLGLDYFMKEDYENSEKHFKRLNKVSRYNLFFDNFFGNILLAWNEAAKGNQEISSVFFKKVPKQYRHIMSIQNSFLNCYFKTNKIESSFQELVKNKNYNFSRYNFFLINNFLHKKNIEAANLAIEDVGKKYSSNLLIKQTEYFLLKGQNKKITNLFNCENVNHILAEFFYIMANLYSSEGDYQLSNFYLKISLLLNSKFLPNKTLLAENLYYQKQNLLSRNIYSSLKKIGPIYSWYASKNISSILLSEKGKEYAISNLENEFNKISKPNFEHYYDLANIYKDSEYFEKSIEFYSLALNKISEDHLLFPKILDRRGTSFERLGNWESAEADLINSLKISPDQAHVLNYLAYTWIDKGINLEKGLEMLKKAAMLKENDGYIIDSLGWAYYSKKNYVEAEFYLQQAVELLPTDPIINDHYADTLWMLNKDIQARYFWNYVLNLDKTEQKLKDVIANKLIFGINGNYN